MRQIAWTTDLAVGIEEVDLDHQRLVSCLNDVFQATQSANADKPSTTLHDALNALRQQSKEHFAHEEGVMRRIAYPALAHHRILHEDLMTALNVLIDQFDQNAKNTLSSDTMQSLEVWLLHHIEYEDKKIGAHTGATA